VPCTVRRHPTHGQYPDISFLDSHFSASRTETIARRASKRLVVAEQLTHFCGRKRIEIWNLLSLNESVLDSFDTSLSLTISFSRRKGNVK
jgi:hypothetical protein